MLVNPFFLFFLFRFYFCPVPGKIVPVRHTFSVPVYPIAVEGRGNIGVVLVFFYLQRGGMFAGTGLCRGDWRAAGQKVYPAAAPVSGLWGGDAGGADMRRAAADAACVGGPAVRQCGHGGGICRFSFLRGRFGRCLLGLPRLPMESEWAGLCRLFRRLGSAGASGFILASAGCEPMGG